MLLGCVRFRFCYYLLLKYRYSLLLINQHKTTNNTYTTYTHSGVHYVQNVHVYIVSFTVRYNYNYLKHITLISAFLCGNKFSHSFIYEHFRICVINYNHKTTNYDIPPVVYCHTFRHVKKVPLKNLFTARKTKCFF